MSTISSNTLFHFTPKLDYLFSILESEFQPRLSLEEFNLDGHKTRIAIPMVCFCDIPLSQIKTHMQTYGCYGLGMTKEWGARQGLNPVLYVKERVVVKTELVRQDCSGR